MKDTFVILWGPGPAWVAGKTVREQPYWDEHADFMDRLFENGMVVLGGPFADETGSMVIVEAESEQEVADLVAKDPFAVQGIFVLRSLKRWVLFLDARREGMTTPAPSPNYRTGKICYLEIPAIDIAESAQFYQRVFGWHVRQRGDGSTAFDDTTGEVSGTWVTGRSPSTEPGMVVWIMVANAAKMIEAITAAGGEIVQPVKPDEQEVYALFRDPVGNILGIYQQAGLAEEEA